MGLGARLALIFATVAAATALLVGGAFYATTDRQIVNEVDDFLRDRADEIAKGQRDQPSDRRDRRDEDQRVAVGRDAEAQVLNSSGDVESNTGVLLPVNESDRALTQSNSGALLRTVLIDGTEYRMITEHLPGGGAIQVARSLDESTALTAVLQTRSLTIAAIVGLLAALLGWVIAQRTTRPLRALSAAVDEVAKTQDFSVPVPTSGRDEVGRLARGFNRMLGTLQISQEQQRRLVQDAAHELRTPLTSMTANVEWLMRAPDLDNETRSETLAGVRRELGELNDLMAEIIELATESREPQPLAPIDFVPVVEDAVERFRRRTGRRVELSASPQTVMGDADSLARAVTNLLSNAHKYSPAESSIAVVVESSGVFVDDAGPGIPVEDRERVFERFYRRAGDRALPGSGLGLAIVAGIVERHHGQVHVGSSERRGARVGFTLPEVHP